MEVAIAQVRAAVSVVALVAVLINPFHANARLVDGTMPTPRSSEKVVRLGVVFHQTASGVLTPVCEFKAHGMAPASMNNTDPGPSTLPPLSVPACSEGQLSEVRPLVAAAQFSETAGFPIVAGVLCLAVAGGSAYWSASGGELPQTIFYGAAVSLPYIANLIGLNPLLMVGTTVCAAGGELVGLGYRQIVTYIVESKWL